MLYTIIVLFAITAIVGIIIFRNWLTSAHTSKTVVYAHGIFAVIGFGLLFYYFLENQNSSIQASLILFGVAAVGGLYMFLRDLKGKFSPMWLAAVHALLAVAGFVLLIFQII